MERTSAASQYLSSQKWNSSMTTRSFSGSCMTASWYSVSRSHLVRRSVGNGSEFVSVSSRGVPSVPGSVPASLLFRQHRLSKNPIQFTGEKSDSHLFPERPFGCFAQKVTVTFSCPAAPSRSKEPPGTGRDNAARRIFLAAIRRRLLDLDTQQHLRGALENKESRSLFRSDEEQHDAVLRRFDDLL